MNNLQVERVIAIGCSINERFQKKKNLSRALIGFIQRTATVFGIEFIAITRGIFLLELIHLIKNHQTVHDALLLNLVVHNLN